VSFVWLPAVVGGAAGALAFLGLLGELFDQADDGSSGWGTLWSFLAAAGAGSGAGALASLTIDAVDLVSGAVMGGRAGAVAALVISLIAHSHFDIWL
jgi:hypothetical protein